MCQSLPKEEAVEQTAKTKLEEEGGNEAAAAAKKIAENYRKVFGDGDGGWDVPYCYNKKPGPNRPFVPLIDYLCCRHNCSIQELQLLLFFIGNRRRILEDLRRSCDLKTTHLKQNLMIPCDDFTCQPATTVFAFNGYMNITVPQYYYVKHKMFLCHPYLPCVIVFGGGRHRSYFPLEVIVVAPKH
jgi:hypothetical protein